MSYAGMGANIVGGELQGWANVLERQAMFDQFRREQALQGQYQQQALGIQDNAVQGASAATAQKQLATGAADREQRYKDVANVPLAFPVANATSYNPQADAAYTSMMGNARAKLGAYSDWQLQQALADIQNKERLRQVTNFAGGQAGNVFPFQMYAAQHSLDDLAMVGAAISSIGGGAANYAQFAQTPQAQQPGLTPTPGAAYSSAYYAPASQTDQTQMAPFTDVPATGY